jgi:hypothetical protein
MKKSVITYATALFVYLGLVSSAKATIVTGSQEWYKYLDAGESVTCIAFYGLGSVEFTYPPEWLVNEYTPPYNQDITGWVTALSVDNKIAYLYGPRATNSSADPCPWFAYELFYQWDDNAPGFDPNYPVYQDMALFDGPFGSEATFAVGWRGTPGVASSWEYKDNNPYSGPYQTDEPYTNPAPEPMTICLLGLGVLFCRKVSSYKGWLAPLTGPRKDDSTKTL